MYSDHHTPTSARRSNTEFLRRMLGGELTADGYPTVRPSDAHPTERAPEPNTGMPRMQNRTEPGGRMSENPTGNSYGCNCGNSGGNSVGNNTGNTSGSVCENSCGNASGGNRPETPSCNSCGCSSSNNCQNNECPTRIPAPSLAMTYCPKQCWRRILDPAQGLSAGSIFEELILPLEVRSGKSMREGGKSRCIL